MLGTRVRVWDRDSDSGIETETEIDRHDNSNNEGYTVLAIETSGTLGVLGKYSGNDETSKELQNYSTV